jgi:two-component system chemotaxis response regulator CheY
MAAILVVDDDETIRSLVKEILTQAGHDCAVSEDGPDALDQIARRRYDLVILDHNMPKMTGTDILLQMRADPRFAEIPVIILTADGLYLRKGEAGTAVGDPDGCLSKPLDKSKLVTLVATLVGRGAAQKRR